MSDEAFARRFYSDRAELLGARRPAPLAARRVHRRGALHAPLRAATSCPRSSSPTTSSRRSRPPSTCSRGSSRTRSRCGSRSRTSRSAAPGFVDGRRRPTAVRVEVRDPDYSPEMPGRLGKLESAISKQRTVKFNYWSISRDERARAHAQPVRAPPRRTASGTSIGRDLGRGRSSTFKVSRIRGDIRFATRRERDFRTPPEFDIEEYRGRPPLADRRRRRRGADRDRAATPPGGSSGRSAAARRSRTASSSRVRVAALLACGSCARTAGRSPSSRTSCAAWSAGRSRGARAPRGHAAEPAAEDAARAPRRRRPARPARSRPERFGVLQALLAYLLAPAATSTRPSIPARELVDNFHIPPDQLEDHLSLLKLVNFGGGCYAVYAELQGDDVRVDKELYGDTFRSAAAADPARGARDQARARVRRPDDRGRGAHPARAACAASSRRPSASSSSRRRPSRTSAPRRRPRRDAERGDPRAARSSRSST